MRKIKNDPSKYITRSSAFAPVRPKKESKADREYARQRAQEFLTAPIDSSGYIVFAPRFQKKQR